MRKFNLKFLTAILASVLLAGSVFAGIGGTSYNPSAVAITGGTITGTMINGSNQNPSGTPAIASGFNTSPSITQANGTRAFIVNFGTTALNNQGNLTMPAAPIGWVCHFQTYSATFMMLQIASTATSIAVRYYNISAGSTQPWPTGGSAYASCTSY